MFLLALVLAAPGAAAIDTADTRLLAEPALHDQRVVFAYANDLWRASLDGADVRRLTSHPGVEAAPHLSPDGRLIVFTGHYDDNMDVFVVSAEGGAPRRLTWHPGEDRALGFTPDGREVLFSSQRARHTTRHRHVFRVAVDGGWPTRLPAPTAADADLSADGRTLAYVPLPEPFLQWKHYRGGQHSRILLLSLQDLSQAQVPQPASRCNDVDPMWWDGQLYFRSDRDGEFNLYRFDPGTREVSALTRHADFPVLHASVQGGRIAYEQAGYLHLLDLATGASQRLRLGVAADLVEARPRYVSGAKWLRAAGLSPGGARVALEFRGEIVTLPREKGDDRNLTRSPGAHERSPSWSPDGRRLAWFSDESGEYALHVAAPDGQGVTKRLALRGAGFYEDLKWAPDSRRVSFSDNARAVWIADVDSGEQTRVDADPLYGPDKVLNHAWSPDSRFLAYTRNSPTFINRIWIYSLEEKTSRPLTDGLSDAREPLFDKGGQYLFFLASTDAGPVQDWFSLANRDMEASRSIYLAVLPKGVASPLAKLSDEETPAPKPAGSPAPSAAPRVTIDWDGLDARILALPLPAAGYDSLQAVAPGRIVYRKQAGAARDDGDWSLARYDLKTRKEDTLTPRADSVQVSADGQRALVQVKDDWSLVDLADTLDLGKFKLKLDALSVRVDPPAEWRQMFAEAWRVNRDYFYDPGFHGADWSALRARYAEFLPHVTSRRDLGRVIRWLCSELAVGHHRIQRGEFPFEGEPRPGGLLGADYVIDSGRYRFAGVLGGLNWTPDLRAPLTEPGVDVRAGEYLLAVEGVDLRPPEDLFARFERTAGRRVELTVGPRADGIGARRVTVVPIEDEQPLRHRAWVEGNLRRVREATQGRAAYVYVPNTGDSGHASFKRYFFPQADRQALILDERYNGGGSVADYYIDLLRRPAVSHWALRYGADLNTPIAGIHGPKVMLIDETAGSGGDLLPWMFRKFGLGPLVGKRTWGGLVGILGFPPLMDGSVVTAPNLAFWTEDGFIIENEGVPPDVEVEQSPAEIVAGRDPQLEKAIELVLAELERHPPAPVQRPPYPVRARRP
jgi:tricorn protease